MTVKVPAGIDDGQTISRQGYGNAGANGGPAGDLLISVIVRPHAIFERDGTSVLMEQNISYAQAVLGAEVEVPTLDGKVKLTIPEGTQPGAVFRLRGKGIPYLRGSGRGDQFVSVNITVPRFGEHYGPEEPQQPPEGSAAGVRRHHGRGTCQVRHLRQEETLSEGHRFHHIKKPFGIPVQDPEGLVCFYDRTDQKRQSL